MGGLGDRELGPEFPAAVMDESLLLSAHTGSGAHPVPYKRGTGSSCLVHKT